MSDDPASRRDQDDPDDPMVEGDEEQELEERYRALVAKPDRMGWTHGPRNDLPGTIIVGGRSYEVRVFEPADDETWDVDGRIHYDETTLWVRRSAVDRRETLLHELLHAVDNSAGTDAGEPVVYAWAPILLDALRGNPELLDILLADLPVDGSLRRPETAGDPEGDGRRPRERDDPVGRP